MQSHKQPAQFKEFEGITSNKLLENVDYVMNRSFDYAAFLKYTSTVTEKSKCVCLLQNMSATTEDV